MCFCSSSMTSILTRIEEYFEFKTRVHWRNVFFISLSHVFALYGVYLIPTMKPISFLWAFFCGLVGDTAISSVVHRLWTHRTYKAKLPMRIFAMLCFMLGGQYSIVTWARDHRAHHKFADTDADPHSAGRGLFFSHCGWLMMKRHPEHKEKGKAIDVSDLWQDPVVRFQQKHFVLLMLLIHVIFPSAVMYYVIGDTLKICIFSGFFARYMISLNLLWCTNSLAHYWGHKPYNKNISATDSATLGFILVGEGWHNFHHTFPWDYRSGPHGQHIIDAFVRLGQAYDLKMASPELIQRVIDKQDLPQNYEAPDTGVLENIYKTAKEIKAA